MNSELPDNPTPPSGTGAPGGPEPDHEAATRAVYDHSATQFAESVGTEVSPRFEAALDRAVLEVFAEQLRTQGAGPVLDAGCGVGRGAAFLATRGIEAGGVDISSQMVTEARTAHPELNFDVAPLTNLPVADSSLLGVLYWYSIITTPPAALVNIWSELRRVLRADGRILIGFQAGSNDRDERPEAYGSGVDMTLFHHDPAEVEASLISGGFEVTARVVRQPELSHETTPQAFLFARHLTA